MFSIIGYDLLTIIWLKVSLLDKRERWARFKFVWKFSSDLSSGNGPRHMWCRPKRHRSVWIITGFNRFKWKAAVLSFFIFYTFWHHSYFRANTLLEKFCESFGASHFYTNLWLCLNSNPSVRLSGTCYLLTHINKLRSMEDQLYLLGSDLGLLVSYGGLLPNSYQMITATRFL